jgi:hypothetical protein
MQWNAKRCKGNDESRDCNGARTLFSCPSDATGSVRKSGKSVKKCAEMRQA